jgi:microcystin-dependent protein
MPTTPNKKLSIPTTGSEVGVWGSNDLNPNFGVIDNICGSVTTLNLASGTNVTLTDTQQQVMVIRLTGALPNNVAVTFSEPGFYIVDNQTTGNFVVTLGGSSGNLVCTPQGVRWHMAFDGSNAFLMNQPEPGTLRKFSHTTTPAWMSANTIPPWIICRGGTAGISTFPALAAILGTAWGGNGISTFGIPDMQGRGDFDLDNGAGRLTSATMSPNGNTIGATGGNELLQQHTHVFTGTAQTWNTNQANIPFGIGSYQIVSFGTQLYVPSSGVSPGSIATLSTTVTPSGTNANAGSGNGQNIPPGAVTGTTFIKT